MQCVTVKNQNFLKNKKQVDYETVNKTFLAGDKFIPETHLRQTGFTYSACGSFTKDKK